MLLEICEITTEWLCVMVAIHVLYARPVRRIRAIVLLCLIYFSVAIIARHYGGWTKNLKIIAYIAIWFYLFQIDRSWKKTIATYGQLILVIPLGQLACHFLYTAVFNTSISYSNGILSNTLLLAMLLVLGRHGANIYKAVYRYKDAIVVIGAAILLFSVLHLYNTEEVLSERIIMVFFISASCVVVLISIWVSAEQEKMLKERELRIHELYAQSFENIISDLRRRQHEYDNQLAALQGLQYSTSDEKSFMEAQEQYLEEIMRERIPTCFLSVSINPMIAGFLYTKYLEAKEHDIVMKFEITDETVKSVPVYDQIEILGTLIDNALEALADSEKTKAYVLIRRLEHFTEYAVMNQSERISNNLLESFFKEGVSTKGNSRGIGLSILKEMERKWGVQIGINNAVHEGENCLMVWIRFHRQEEGG